MNGWRRAAIGWCAMRTTSWCCARAAKRPRPPWRRLRAFVADNGLRLHPDKTHIGDCRQAGEGFDFLGYRFEAGRRLVRKKSLTRLKDTYPGEDETHTGRQPRAHRRRPQPDAARLVRLLQARPSRHLRRRSTSSSADGCARSCASRKSVPASVVCQADHQRWPNAFFAEAGLLALHTAWLTARHSR